MMKFEIICSGRNVSGYIAHCLNSIAEQDYPNYRVHYIDDASDDKTLEIAKAMAPEGRSIIHQNTERVGKAASLYRYMTTANFDDDSVIAYVDADDQLLGKQVLSRIAKEYQKGWEVVWSTYKLSTDFSIGHCAPLTPFTHHRKQGFLSSHLFTYRARFLKRIPFSYICDASGRPVMSACDVALIIPILDQTIKRKFVSEPLYLYTDNNQQSHHNDKGRIGGSLSSKEQHLNATYLYSLPHLEQEPMDEDFFQKNLFEFIKNDSDFRQRHFNMHINQIYQNLNKLAEHVNRISQMLAQKSG
jgi:glycosyltransferase involved in cell wall biosynthesis